MASAGILERHTSTCAKTTNKEADCNCKPSIQAWTYDRRSKKKVTKNFGSAPNARSAAKAWRQDTAGALRRGTMRAPTATTVRQAWEAWIEGAREGSVRTRSGDRYKPSALRGYETSMTLRILPDLGAVKLSDVQRSDVQAIVDRMLAKNLDPSTIKNSIMPLRVVFRRAITRGEVAVNPTTGLELPAVRGTRDRIVAPTEAATLIAALPELERAQWATAFYGGLRLGELRALKWTDVDLEANVIRVERGWDPAEGEIEAKSRAGKRTVPIAKVLREHLIAHRLRSGRVHGYVFGRGADRTFNPTSIYGRAAKAWKQLNEKRVEAELEPIKPVGLHEARHCYASLMIAAGVNAKALSTYMGHSSITITIDRYGHLMPGNEGEAAGLLDTYLSRSMESIG